MIRKILAGAGGVLALAIGYLLLWPVPLEPAAWTPPEAPVLEGPYAPNTALAPAERLPTSGEGPEDVALDAEGRIYCGLKDGRIVRLRADGGGEELFADTGGRPLGLHFDDDGDLLVADADRGLLSVAPDGSLEVLSTGADGLPFGFADDVDVAPDGTVYFSDASHRWGHEHVREAVMEHRPNGRLLAWDPDTGSTRVVLGELYFANGVAVSPDGSFLLVVETTAYRVKRHFLTGPRAGETELFIDNLPGFPDGISAGSGGRFWLALYSPRIAIADRTMPTPWLRKVIYRLPRSLQPDPVRCGHVLGLDAEGRVVANLQDPAPDSYSPVTSVQEHGGQLYLGSFSYPGIARLPLPPWERGRVRGGEGGERGRERGR